MTHYKTYKNSIGEQIEIHYDHDPINPLDCDGLFNFFTFEKRYRSIHEHNYSSMKEWYDEMLFEGAFDKHTTHAGDAGMGPVGRAKYLAEKLYKKGYFALPILKYEHSDVKYYLGDSIDYWDGSVVGFVWVNRSEICREYGQKIITKNLRQQLEKSIDSMLKSYTDYANGYVYSYFHYDSEGELIDSCGSYMGYASDQELLEEMLHNIDTQDDNFVEFVEAA